MTSSPTISDDKLSLFTGCAAGAAFGGTTTLSTGVWQHVALTIDAAGNAVLYLNGVQEATGNARGGMSVSAGNYLIGAYWAGGVISSASHFDGALDELQIYNRVLTPSEISELYNAGQGQCGAVVGWGLVAGYHFDEGSGTLAADFSGNGKTASLINGTGWVPSPLACGSTVCPDLTFQAQIGNVSNGIQTLLNAPTPPRGAVQPLSQALNFARKTLVQLAAGDLSQGLATVQDTLTKLLNAATKGVNTTALQQMLAEDVRDRVERAISDVETLVGSSDLRLAEAKALFEQGKTTLSGGNFQGAVDLFAKAQQKLLTAGK